MGFDTVTALAALFTTCAWALTLASTAWCSFVKRNVNYTGNPGDLSELDQNLLDFLFSSHGVGYWGWELGGSCFSYTINGQDPSFDTKYNSSRAFTIVCCILGGVLMFFLWFSICIPVGSRAYMITTLFLLMTCLFQGLTLLIFKSSICAPGFFGYSFIVPPDINLSDVSADCSLSAGSRCAIAATACYFAATLPCCFRAKQPLPQSDDEDIDEKQADVAQDETDKKDEVPAEEEPEKPQEADVEA